MRFIGDQEAMRYAISLAQKGLGQTFPNPVVGAVITTADGELVSSGYHQGKEHAEVVAINAATQDLSGCTIYVTLEPCNHFGKTGPCTEAIIKSGISRVCFATYDPNPIASGGYEKLQAAGIEVIAGVEMEEAADLNRDWLTKVTLGRPRIVWKIAATLDGKIAAADFTSKWITCEEARFDVAKLRAQADAILSSTATVLADNPALTSKGFGPDPVRVILGEREIPQDFQVFAGGAETIQIKSRSIEPLLALFKSRGFNRVFLECGPTLGTALYRAGIIDEVIIYQAPTFLGSGISAIGDLGITTLSERSNLVAISSEKIGSDIKSSFYRRTPNGEIYQSQSSKNEKVEVR